MECTGGTDSGNIDGFLTVDSKKSRISKLNKLGSDKESVQNELEFTNANSH